MSTSIELLRHGETERGGGFRGSLDDPLTPHGWQQMRNAVGDAGPWDILVSSPLQRCAAFARELAAQHGLPLHLEPNLRELHFGDWEGRSAAELMQGSAEALGLFWADPYGFTPPGGEPLAQFEARVVAAIERLQLRFAGQRLLVICHAGVMRLLLARAQGLARERLLEVVVGHGELLPLELAPPAEPAEDPSTR
ncbi:alpha-ribazole phosphatase family protein [Pseudomonas stutzeri]|uniref:Histidine phosphatase family protein n=1 Tax=Stutzerimonas stutzeri TaxID=316 RepID=A0A2N8S2E4_STUST|nr:alpha-ribazole phosphatase family protein [Stutzerimonas stutzeri]MCQ4296364.1 alpha-ribazole phosphatase family protein [Stutzerimonas stutzeri]PNF80800.1 histidine phosphatase family protein [Stutzerimonas stutzeri]